MAFLTITELKTHLYNENVDVISRSDDTIVQAAIDAAIAEAKGYLAAFDVTTVFAATGSSRNALLLVFVKDIATWHFIVLCNAGVEMELRQDRYERAVAWLKAVQKGDIAPDLPAAIEADGETRGVIIFGSNTKREQHF
jgi:phage gp36-like protein